MDMHSPEFAALHALVGELTQTRDSAEAELAMQRQYQALTKLLQNLRTRHELRFVLGMHLERLFPETRGSLYLLDDASRGRLCPIVCWGLEPGDDEAVLPACVAQHLDHTASLDSLLTTVVPPLQAASQGVCAPLMADGELLGVLFAEPEAVGDPTQRPLPDDTMRRLFEVADRIAMPLNLMHLRDKLQQQGRLDPLTGIPNRLQTTPSSG